MGYERLVTFYPEYCAKIPIVYCKRCDTRMSSYAAYVDVASGDLLCKKDLDLAGSMIRARQEKGFHREFRSGDLYGFKK